MINTDGTPETQKSAFAQAVQQKVNVVLYSAVDRATFAQYLPAFKANNTFLSACCITDPVDDASGIGYAIDVPAQTGVIGQLMAAVDHHAVQGQRPILCTSTCRRSRS